MALQKAKQYDKASTCFWSKKNKSFALPTKRQAKPLLHKPRRFDKSILSDLPWIFKEEFYMVEGKKNLPGEAENATYPIDVEVMLTSLGLDRKSVV